MSNETFEMELLALIDSFGDPVPSYQLHSMREEVKAGEPEIALEDLCTQLYEYEIAVAPDLLAKIRELGQVIGISSRFWDKLEGHGVPGGRAPAPPEYFCPVCGYGMYDAPWKGELPSDNICPCCGIQFGYDDFAGGNAAMRNEVYDSWRRKWIDGGLKWWSISTPPPYNWNANEQLCRVQQSKGE